MDGLTYSSHFALSFSSGILFKNILIRVTKLPVFKLLPTEKQSYYFMVTIIANIMYSYLVNLFPEIEWNYSTVVREQTWCHTCTTLPSFPPKISLLSIGPIHVWIHLKIVKKHFERKSRTLPIIQRRRAVKDTTYTVSWIFSGFFFAMYICCVFFAFISSFHGYNNW